MARFDVVKDYDWTSMPRGSAMRGKAPRVWVKSYKLKANNITLAIKGFVAIAQSSDAKTFYDKLYSDSSTPEDDFNFPFFDDNVRQFTNNFGDTFQAGIGAKAFETAKAVAGELADVYNVTMGAVGKGHPGTYIESPKFYEYNSDTDSPLRVSFVLANTINADSVSKNYELIKKLTTINRPERINSIAMEPPRIYQVKVPGHRFIKWAYCDSFSVSFQGTKREIDGKIVPEAYLIDMSFKSLTMEHAGFMNQV